MPLRIMSTLIAAISITSASNDKLLTLGKLCLVIISFIISGTAVYCFSTSNKPLSFIKCVISGCLSVTAMLKMRIHRRKLVIEDFIKACARKPHCNRISCSILPCGMLLVLGFLVR
jgi:hypothetical protein